MRREPALRPENQVALALAELERIKALLVKVTDGTGLVIETGAGEGDTTAPVEAGPHTLYGVKHTRAFRATDGGGLNVDYEQGQIWMAGTFYAIGAGTTAVADDTTNYVYVDITGVVADNAAAFPDDCWPIAEVTTVAGAITAIADRRSYSAQGTWGGGVVLGNPLLVGDDDLARGRLTLYGDGIFTQDGGEAQFYLAANHDAAFEYWIIQSWEDDLFFQRSDYGVVPLKLKADRTVEIGGANFIFSASPSEPRITVDANDYTEYNRPGNFYSWFIGSTEYMRLSATQLDLMNGVFMDADDVELPHLGAATYDTVEDANMVIHSAGWISGGVVSDAGGGNIDVSAGTGLIRSAATAVSPLFLCDWALLAGAAIPNNTTRYVGVEYNAGTPQIDIRIADTWDLYTDFPLAIVVNEGGAIHIIDHRQTVGDHINAMNERMHQTDHVSRDDFGGGLIFSEVAVRNVVVSGGAFWVGLVRSVIGPIDTSGVDTFDTYSSGGLEAPGVAQWPNLQYDNGGVLANINNNWWANLWWYLEMDGDLVMVYGTNHYATQAQAEAESPPVVLPDRVAEHGVLACRFIFQWNAATASQILSPFIVAFEAAGVTDHGDLAGLTPGDDHPDYLLLIGRAGGQAAIGGTGGGDNLTLESTSNVAKGVVQVVAGSPLGVDVIQETTPNAGVDLETSHFENGYAWIGNTGDPTNVTAGDLTASRLIIPDAALIGESRLVQILDTYTPGAGVWNTLYARANPMPGIGLAADDVRAGKFEMLVQPTADYVGQATGFYSEALHSGGVFDVATLSGFFSQAVQNVAATQVDNLFAARVQYKAISGNVAQAIGLLVERGAVGDLGAITIGTGIHIAASAAPAPANDIAIRSLGGHHRLVGDVRIGADAAPVNALEIVDANFYLDIASAKPRINFDVGDYLEYDRAANQYVFMIGAAPAVTFDAATAALPPLVLVGVDDTTAGTLRVYGPSVGDQGGALELYLSDVHDAVFQSWNFDAYLDDLRIYSSDGADIWYFRAGGAFEIPDSIKIAGDLDHDGGNIGFFGTAPVAQAAAYTPANVNADRAYDADATTLDELADVLGTLIADLQSYGLLQ